MDEHSQGARGGGPSHRSVEIGVALFTAAFALIVVAGSVQAGVGWGAEGPKAGFFPFYVGLVILGSSIINFGAVISLTFGGSIRPFRRSFSFPPLGRSFLRRGQ